MNTNILRLSAITLASLLATPLSAGILSKNAPERTWKASPKSSAPKEEMTAGYNAPASTDAKEGVHWYASASYLYWEALQDGMTLAWTLPSSSSDSLPNTGSHRQNFDFGYKSGFRVGVGCYFQHHDSWALNLGFTRLAFTDTDTKHAPEGKKFGQNEWLFTSNQGFYQKIEAKWHLSVNFIDANLSRPFYNGAKLTLTPLFGLRSALLYQKYDVTYTTAADAHIDSKSKSNCWAIGPRGGVQGLWLLGKGFRLQGNAAASLLYSNYNIHHKEENDLTPSSEEFSGKEHQRRGRLIGELGLGLGWGRNVNRDRQHFDLLVGYDFTYMPSQNVMRQMKDDYNTQSSTGSSDLTLQGVTVTVSVDF